MSETRKFGNLSGTLASGQVHSFELKSKGVTYISDIDVSFQPPVGQTKTSKPFHLARLLVVKAEVKSVTMALNAYSELTGSEIILDKTIHEYEGFRAQYNQLKSDENSVISVILTPAYLTDNLSSEATLKASITVLGTETNKSLSLQPI